MSTPTDEEPPEGNDRKKGKGDKSSDVRRPRTAIVAPGSEEAKELQSWIFNLTANGEHVEKIEVLQLFNSGRTTGTIPHTEFNRSNRPFTSEHALRLAHLFIGAAQRNCDRVVHRRQSYGIRAYDAGKAIEGVEYRQYDLDLRPKNNYAAPGAESLSLTDGIDDDELVTDGKKLAFLQVQEARKGAQHQLAFAAGMSGEMFLLMQAHIQQLLEQNAELSAENRDLRSKNSELIDKMDALGDRHLDRELAREDKKLWIEIKREGWKTGKSYIKSMFGPGGGGANADDEPAHVEGRALCPDSKERTLLEDFIEDCQKEKIDAILFGDWTFANGVAQCERESDIFTAAQVKIMLGVQRRELPVEALDDLLPESLAPTAIKLTQMKKAEAHVSEGVGTALMMIVNLRREAAERKKAKEAAVAEAAPVDAPKK